MSRNQYSQFMSITDYLTIGIQMIDNLTLKETEVNIKSQPARRQHHPIVYVPYLTRLTSTTPVILSYYDDCTIRS